MPRQQDVLPPPQFSGSVSSGTPPGVVTITQGTIEPPEQKAADILGSSFMKTGPSSFPTIPAGFVANAHYYPGLSYSYRGAALVETPSHGQIRFATYDIQNIQLTMRGAVSTDIIAQWQMLLTDPAAIMPGG